MRSGRVLGLVVLAAAALVVIPAERALACSCVPSGPDRKALETSDAVFAGIPVDHHNPDEGQELQSSGAPIAWVFEVDSVGAGDVRSQETIFSAASSASCGFEFTEGKRYVVFASLGDERDPTAEPGRLNASLCSNTRAIGDEQLPFLDGEPLAITKSDATGEDKTDAVTFWDVAPIAIGIALVAVAGVALFAVRRRVRSP